MIDFFLINYSLLTHSLEFLAAVTGIFYFKNYKFTAAKYFICFLILIAFCDLLSYYTYFVGPDRFLRILIGTRFEKNYWFVTLYWDIGAILFLSFFFYKILKTNLYRMIVKFLGYGYLLLSSIYSTCHWDVFFTRFFILLNLLGALIVLVCSIFYFMEILLGDEILVFYKSFNFYASTTVFVWWLIITPLCFYDSYYKYEVGHDFFDIDFALLRRSIYLFANMFMYLTYTFALIWCRPEKN